MSNQYFWCKILPRYFGVFISHFEGDDASPKFTVRKGMNTGQKYEKRLLQITFPIVPLQQGVQVQAAALQLVVLPDNIRSLVISDYRDDRGLGVQTVRQAMYDNDKEWNLEQCRKSIHRFHNRLYNHGEGPYQGLLLVESGYYRFHI